MNRPVKEVTKFSRPFHTFSVHFRECEFSKASASSFGVTRGPISTAGQGWAAAPSGRFPVSLGPVHERWGSGARDWQAVWSFISLVWWRELSVKVKLMIYRLIYVLPLTRGHQLWVVTEEMRLWIQAAEFLLKSEGSALEIIIAEYYCQISSMHLNKTFLPCLKCNTFLNFIN